MVTLPLLYLAAVMAIGDGETGYIILDQMKHSTLILKKPETDIVSSSIFLVAFISLGELTSHPLCGIALQKMASNHSEPHVNTHLPPFMIA